MAVDILFQNSDNKFNVSVTSGIDNSVLAANLFSDAFYVIANKRGDILLQKTLGNGVTVDGDLFLVTLDDGELTFFGNYEHQFSVVDTAGNILPPVFKRKLKIDKAYKRQV